MTPLPDPLKPKNIHIPAVYITATPIGNLADITLRALHILSLANLIIAEDTRQTKKLLAHYRIPTPPMTSFHDHSKIQPQFIEKIRQIIQQQGMVVLVSDAGTPTISDPGYKLLRRLADEQIPLTPLPGPSSPIAALSVAALPTNQWCFAGFPPHQAAKRKKFFQSFAQHNSTLIFFESPHRLTKSLADMVDIFGAKRQITITRELTKKFEQIQRDSLQNLLLFYQNHPPKGEFTLLIAPPKK